jgi:hypothetical protein
LMYWPANYFAYAHANSAISRPSSILGALQPYHNTCYMMRTGFNALCLAGWKTADAEADVDLL